MRLKNCFQIIFPVLFLPCLLIVTSGCAISRSREAVMSGVSRTLTRTGPSETNEQPEEPQVVVEETEEVDDTEENVRVSVEEGFETVPDEEADYPDEEKINLGHLHTLPETEELRYNASYLGMTVATLTARIRGREIISGREAHAYELRIRTQKFFDLVYRVDDRFVAYMDIERKHVLRFEEYRREGGYKRDAVVTYDHEAREATEHHLLNKETKTFGIPRDVQDGLGAVYFFRMLPLEAGEAMAYDVNIGNKVYQLFGVMTRRRTIQLPGIGRVEALELQPYAELEGERVRQGRLTGYFTPDERRVPLMAVVRASLFGRVIVSIDPESYKQIVGTGQPSPG